MKKNRLFLTVFLAIIFGYGILDVVQTSNVVAITTTNVPQKGKEISNDERLKETNQVNKLETRVSGKNMTNPTSGNIEEGTATKKNEASLLIKIATIVGGFGSILAGLVHLIRFIVETRKTRKNDEKTSNVTSTKIINRIVNPALPVISIIFGLVLFSAILLPRFGIGFFAQPDVYNKGKIELLKEKMDEKDKATKQEKQQFESEIKSLKDKISENEKLNKQKDKQISEIMKNTKGRLTKQSFVSIIEKYKSIRFIRFMLIILLIYCIIGIVTIIFARRPIRMKSMQMNMNMDMLRRHLRGSSIRPLLASLRSPIFIIPLLTAICLTIIMYLYIYTYPNPRIYLLQCSDQKLMETVERSKDGEVLRFRTNGELRGIVDSSGEELLFLFDNDGKMIWPAISK